MKKVLLGMLALGLLAGCSSEPPKTSEPAKPAPAKPADEYLTGRVAFQKLFVTARAWAADTQPFRLESQYTKGAPVAEGNAGIWRATFASTQRRAAKSYLWSGVASEEDARERGISPGLEDTFNPSNPSTRPFDFAFLKIDSDQAFQVAQEHGGKELMKKTPDQPVLFVLDWDSRKNQLLWHVVYGDSRGDAKLTVAVDASTGGFLRVEK
ncbi:MAG TPA: hypothetical protein VGQ94_04220 [Terriglobales bacterium]|nr:hypothetical protein [Terriglobales bacterium]